MPLHKTPFVKPNPVVVFRPDSQQAIHFWIMDYYFIYLLTYDKLAGAWTSFTSFFWEKSAFVTAVTAELVVNQYPGHKAALTFS